MTLRKKSNYWFLLVYTYFFLKFHFEFQPGKLEKFFLTSSLQLSAYARKRIKSSIVSKTVRKVHIAVIYKKHISPRATVMCSSVTTNASIKKKTHPFWKHWSFDFKKSQFHPAGPFALKSTKTGSCTNSFWTGMLIRRFLMRDIHSWTRTYWLLLVRCQPFDRRVSET